MNKKRLIIMLSIVAGLILTVSVVYLFNNYQKNQEKQRILRETEASRTEWGINNQSQLATSAVEAYLQQNKAESTNARNARVGKYFIEKDIYPADLLGTSVIKTSAKATGVTYCEEQEGGNLCLIVDVDLIKTSPESINIKESLKYWVTIEKNDKDNFVILDLGLWDLED